MKKLRILYSTLSISQFVLSLVSIVFTYNATDRFTVVIYPEDLRETAGERYQTQILAERILARIKESSSYTLYTKLLIALSVSFIVAALSVAALYFMRERVSEAIPPRVPIPPSSLSSLTLQTLQTLQTPPPPPPLQATVSPLSALKVYKERGPPPPPLPRR